MKITIQTNKTLKKTGRRVMLNPMEKGWISEIMTLLRPWAGIRIMKMMRMNYRNLNKKQI